MAVGQPWVARLRNARSSAEQITTLRALKSELVGHAVKKEQEVNQGILDPVVRLIVNKKGLRQDKTTHDHTFASRPLSEDESIRLQGLQCVASIALGGPQFLAPLHSASALPAILSNLCPSNNPSQLVLASLRALSNLADSAALASNTSSLYLSSVAEGLFSRTCLSSIRRIVSQISTSSQVQIQIIIAASLISRLCREERHQQSLASSGVLDALATRLAGFVVADGGVIPGADILAQRDNLQEHFPPPAPPNAKLSVILEAISTIIADSKYRASRLLYSPSILAVLPLSEPIEFVPRQNARAALKTYSAASSGTPQSQRNAVDYLLPIFPLHQSRAASSQVSAFPPLGASSPSQNLAINGRSGTSRYTPASFPSWNEFMALDSGLDSQNVGTEIEEPESPLVAYLILILRTRDGLDRLMATSVLTALFRLGLTNKSREAAIGLMVVPILVQSLDYRLCFINGKENFEDPHTDWTIKERAPAVLARLITDSEPLQKATFDADAAVKLGKLLKAAYTPVPEAANPSQWSPNDDEHDNVDSQPGRLGNSGQIPLLAHRIKVRESTLKAIAALVPFKDEYRKAVVEQGIMPYIVESMSANPGKPTASKSNEKLEKDDECSDTDKMKLGYGVNPISVLIAAAGAVRALSRSVSVLRTTLIDNGVAEPTFRLLSHPDIEVQIAATATVCNLLTDVSPMRESIADRGVVKVLCEHAHSMNAKLRLNAVWALKHFIQGISNDLKKICLEELGQGWLVQLICDDTEDEALSSSRIQAERPQSGDEMDEDVEMDQREDHADVAASGSSVGRSTSSRPSSSRSKSIKRAELKLAALREAETDPKQRARKDDIAVQEQGLDFIRNLISGAGQGGSSDTTEMIDFLFDSLQQERVFDILASKLKPKVSNNFSRVSPPYERRIQPPQAEILAAVVYILVHMAASIPRHRQIVISQTELLKLLVPQFQHSSIEVRMALCHLVSNLTWVDNEIDSIACRQRALELKRLGFLDKLQGLEQDAELNVRERAKTSLWQMKQHL